MRSHWLSAWTVLNFFLGVSLLFGACRSEQEQLLVPEEKLIEVLADVHIAEAASYNLYGDVKDSLIQQYYEQVFRMHQVNAEDFWQTMDYLEQHPNEMSTLYEQVLKHLKTIEAESKK